MANLGEEFFSGVSYPVVGIVLALIVFDAFKEGVLLPIFNGIYHSDEIDRGTELSYEESGALVVTRGPFRFRIGYLVSRLLLFAALLLVALPCMWRWKRRSGRAAGSRTADSFASEGEAGEMTAEASPTAVAAADKIKLAAAAPKAAVAAHAHVVAV